jgi:hypothetical protein
LIATWRSHAAGTGNLVEHTVERLWVAIRLDLLGHVDESLELLGVVG